MKKLGIYIPTYNRVKELQICIKNFLEELKETDFDIFISDNNSTDDTEVLLKKMMRKHKQIHYIKNGIKNGNSFGSNILNLLKMINTEFVFIFGDDDIIKKGSIKTILKNLENNDFLHINSEVWSSNMAKKLEDRRLSIYHDIDYEKGDHEKVLRNSDNGYAGFLSVIITRGEYINKELRTFRYKNLDEEDFFHVPLLFRSIVGKKGRFISKPLIKYRSTNKSTFAKKEFELVFSEFPNALKRLEPFYSKKVISDACRVSLYRVMAISCVSKFRYPGKVALYKKIIKANKYLVTFKKLAIIFTLYMPLRLIIIICKQYQIT